MTFYLKIFILTSLVFGIGTFFIYILNIGVGGAVVMSLLTGSFLGFLLTSITGLINFMSVKKSHPHPTQENVEVHHLRIITMNLPYEESFELCKTSLQLLKKPAIHHQNLDSGEISARARMSWRDWGDRVEFRLREEEETLTYIEVSSKPFMPGSLLDYGHNLQNVEAIITFLEEHNPSN